MEWNDMVIENNRNCVLTILNYLCHHTGSVVADLLEECSKKLKWQNSVPRTYYRGHQDATFIESMEKLANEGFIEIGDGDYVFMNWELHTLLENM